MYIISTWWRLYTGVPIGDSQNTKTFFFINPAHFIRSFHTNAYTHYQNRRIQETFTTLAYEIYPAQVGFERYCHVRLTFLRCRSLSYFSPSRVDWYPGISACNAHSIISAMMSARGWVCMWAPCNAHQPTNRPCVRTLRSWSYALANGRNDLRAKGSGRRGKVDRPR